MQLYLIQNSYTIQQKYIGFFFGNCLIDYLMKNSD